MAMDFILIALFFTGTCTFLYVIFCHILTRLSIGGKLKEQKTQVKGKAAKGFSDSIGLLLLPLKNKLLQFTPRNIKKNLEEVINFSGSKYQTGDILLLKLLLSFFLALAGSFSMIKSNNAIFKIVFIIVIMAFGFIIPDIFLKRRIKSRQQEIRRALPPFIDYLTISVEAGLGLDMAISRVISQIRGSIAEEMANAMTEIKYGKTKKEAFKNLAAKVNLMEFTSFLNALTTGEQLGVSLGNLLKVQGQQIREKRKQKLQEEAYKIPVKLTFPLVLFILPGLFIVLLGPALIQVISSFIK